MKRCSHKNRIVAFLAAVFILPVTVFGFAIPPDQDDAGKQAERGMLLARHRGTPHGLMHSMGRGGSGFCPQRRSTQKAPDGLYHQKNPLPANQENIDAGRALYHIDAQPTACKICHGADGNGLGMMTDGLNPKPRNFTCRETMKTVTDGQMFWIIKNGSPGTGMLPYRELSEDQIWQLVLYIRKFAE